MRVPSPSDRIYVCVRQFTMNLRYAFNNCAFARVRTYVLNTQSCVLRDQLRVLRVRKCADFHENRLIYAYLSTREATKSKFDTDRSLISLDKVKF